MPTIILQRRKDGKEKLKELWSNLVELRLLQIISCNNEAHTPLQDLR